MKDNEKKAITPKKENKQDFNIDWSKVKIIWFGNRYYCSLDKFKRRFRSEEMLRNYFKENQEHYL